MSAVFGLCKVTCVTKIDGKFKCVAWDSGSQKFHNFLTEYNLKIGDVLYWEWDYRELRMSYAVKKRLDWVPLSSESLMFQKKRD